jgi:hypothetical protein
MLHADEAREHALARLREITDAAPEGVRVVLIDDLYGRIRVLLWLPGAEPLEEQVRQGLSDAAGRYWTGEIWRGNGASESDRLIYEQAWNEARDIVPGKLRVLDRHRARGGWLVQTSTPIWPCEQPSGETPAIVVFYSFKGGVGRTTALASFAIHRARRGERVVVVDGDLDAPGIGSLLAADEQGTTARWGVVDYLLEQPIGALQLDDYYHACRRDVTGEGEVLVFPAGRVDQGYLGKAQGCLGKAQGYLGKLARVDLEPSSGPRETHPFEALLEHIRKDLQPSWILLDARTGLDDPSGMFLSGLAHLHVLLGTASGQTWSGLRLVLQRLGAERLQQGAEQADCVLVQAMVPRNPQVSQFARVSFEEQSLAVFSDVYYAADEGGGDARDRRWTISDIDSQDAPHRPSVIHYDERLAFFRDIGEVADALRESREHEALNRRIHARLAGGDDALRKERIYARLAGRIGEDNE